MTLPTGLPDRTLGWGFLEWGSTFLAQPDGENKGDTWVYTDEQARFILWFYAVDEFGRYVYRRGMLMRVKGFGKSPLLSAISCTELLGPVVFAGWDASGNPVGKPHPSPRVQLAGVSQDQADNTMSLVVEMLAQGEAVDEYGLDIGLTRIYSRGGKLEPVTASVKSREGQRPTFASLDETGLWTPQAKGPALAATIRRNLAKVRGRSIETTNAFVPGEESVAETTYELWERVQRGEMTQAESGLLLDNRSAPLDVDVRDKPSTLAALRYCYGDATWVDLERIWQEIQDPATREDEARRFYLNQIVASSDQWIGKEKWDACLLVDQIEPGEEISLGFDGGIRDDSTALIGCRIRDALIFPIKIWERPEGRVEWEVDVLDVEAEVRRTMKRFRVVRMNADPAHWQDVLGRWSLEYEQIWEWWTNRPLAMARAVERFETAVLTRELRQVGDATLTRHILNTRIEETAYGRKLRKDAKGGARKIDASIGSVLAYEARAEHLSEPPPPEGAVYGF